jgi:hypothetical protein
VPPVLNRHSGGFGVGFSVSPESCNFNSSYPRRSQGRRRWLSGTILASLVLDSTGFWVRISARTPILRNITTGGDITGGFCPGAGFPSCRKLIYRVSEDNFRGSACVSEWMLISVKKDGGLVFHNLNGCRRTINLNK